MAVGEGLEPPFPTYEVGVLPLDEPSAWWRVEAFASIAFNRDTTPQT